MAAARGKLNPLPVVRLSATRVTIKTNPDRLRGRGFLSSAVALTLTEPPLRFGDDAAINRRVINKCEFKHRADTRLPRLGSFHFP